MDLYFEELGDSSKPALIIVHGFFASSRNWRQIAIQLAADYHVYVVDMRNHGASPHAEVMDYPSMAEDLFQFMRARQLAKASLLGHSMGGKACLWFALAYPDFLDKLVVVDIAPVTYQHNFDQMIDALMALPLASLKNRKQADDFLSPVITAADFRQFLLQNLVLQDGQYRWRINLAIFKQAGPYVVAFPATDGFSAYLKPLLVVAGADSQYVNQAAFAAAFPQATFVTIANAGHWVHVQAPEAFLKAVRDFLARH